MKTKTEYLKDLELTTLEDKKELKKHYRKLVKIYNLDNGTSKNELRIKEVHSAYEALLNDKYKAFRLKVLHKKITLFTVLLMLYLLVQELWQTICLTDPRIEKINKI